MSSPPAVSPATGEDPLLAGLRPRRTRSWAALGLLSVLLLAAAWAAAAPSARLWLSHRALEVTRSEASVAHANAAISAPTPQPPTPVEVEPVPVAPQPTAATAVAAPEPVKRAPRKAAAAPAAATADTPRQPDPCDPFYSVDERGIRHPKPECL